MAEIVSEKEIDTVGSSRALGPARLTYHEYDALNVGEGIVQGSSGEAYRRHIIRSAAGPRADRISKRLAPKKFGLTTLADGRVLIVRKA